MNRLELELKEVRTYQLQPFGRFKIKGKVSDNTNKKVGVIPVSEISYRYDEGMPIEGEEEKALIKFMIKHKTDVLVSMGGRFYTRIGKGFSEIYHRKLNSYKAFLSQKGLTDSAEAWGQYENENGEY